MSAFLKTENVVAVNSGSAALHIALILAGVSPGDEVVSTAMTAEPTNTVIAQTGAKIVWGDVNSNTGLLTAETIEPVITERTKAIVLVHYAGMVCEMDAIWNLGKRLNIPIIEDAAHALGALYYGDPVGKHSEYACFSFQAIKHMTTVDGGLIAFKNPELMDEALRLRWFGLSKRLSRLENDINRIGYKYAMNNVNATIGLVQRRYADKVIKAHVDNGRYFDEKLSGIAGLEIPPYSKNSTPAYWLYTLLVEDRDSFIKMLEDKGIQASTLHHRSDTHSVFRGSMRSLPGLDSWYSRFVHIPCGWWVSPDDRERIAEVISMGW